MKKKFNGEKLKELREAAARTLEEVAVQADFDASSLSLWENGRKPGPRNLRKLAQYYNVPTSAFFAGVLALLLVMAPAANAGEPRDRAYDNNVAILTIIGEAGGEGIRGMVGVAEVIRKRAAISGKGFGEVCLAPRQFSFWNDRDQAGAWLEMNMDANMMNAALLAWAMSEASDLTGGAIYFESSDFPEPRWAAGKKKTAVVGKHTFWREIGA